MISTYQEAVSFLYDNLPMYQRIGASAFKKDLTNTIALCHALGDPHLKFKSIHVAGTNGKGSSSHMLASVLQASGYKTGLYTSPHLKSFTERVRINGVEIEQAFVIDFVNRITSIIHDIKPSFFELTVAMAFDYFARQQVDIAVIEVGLGGRLDSTNVITPEVSLITNIGWDHQDLLGNSLAQIASEKAGIIKRQVPVVVSEFQEDIDDVFLKRATDEHADIVFASDHYSCSINPEDLTLSVVRDGEPLLHHLKLPLLGQYQRKNVPGVLAVIDLLRKRGFSIEHNHLVNGLENVVKATGLKGRWQKLGNNPMIICDTGHNVDGMREVLAQINAQVFDELHIVFGCVKDKDVTPVLALLPKKAKYYFCQAKIPRAMDAATLAQQASAFNLSGMVIADVNEAINAARRSANPRDFIFIGGSTFVVAEIDNL